MKKIETKEDIKLFRREIKKELKKFLSYVEDDNLDGYGLAFELLYDDYGYICHIFARAEWLIFIKAGKILPDIHRKSIHTLTVTDFMYNNGFEINKDTSDYKLNKVANRIIKEYNDQIEAEWRKKYGME